MHFQQQDLEGDRYDWQESKKMLYTGQPSRRLFDRYDGYQVLFLINFYGSLSERFSIQEGKMIEQKLLHELPVEARSEIAVFNWIREQAFHVQ